MVTVVNSAVLYQMVSDLLWFDKVFSLYYGVDAMCNQ